VAARIPDRVRALVLEDPTFEMTGRRIAETAFPDTFAAYLPHIGSDRPASEVARALARATVRVPGSDDRVPLGSIRDLASLRYTASCLRQLDPTVIPLILECRWLEDYDVKETLAGVVCPTLFLQADPETGGALPDDYARELVGQIGDGLLVKLPRTGHNIHSTQTEVLLRPLLPFLASLG
jgi:pimeloyl-ACP methyl ester carboxylesterase